MINVAQFRVEIVRPALQSIGLWSEAAENLVLGTGVQESLLAWVRQRNAGPALGFYQMEPATASDICHRFLSAKAELSMALGKATWPHIAHPPGYSHLSKPDIARLLVEDMRFSTIMCRLRYWMMPAKLPDANDIEGLAGYWKRYYNTPLGKGLASDWADKYRRFCAPES